MVNMVSFDIAKAFDSVNHWFLLAKLKPSVSKERCLTGYHRTFTVGHPRFSGVLSDKAPCLSCVPKGSAIGPLPFLPHMNTLPATLGDSTVLLADDVKKVFPSSQSSHFLSTLSSAWT